MKNRRATAIVAADTTVTGIGGTRNAVKQGIKVILPINAGSKWESWVMANTMRRIGASSRLRFPGCANG